MLSNMMLMNAKKEIPRTWRWLVAVHCSWPVHVLKQRTLRFYLLLIIIIIIIIIISIIIIIIIIMIMLITVEM